MPTLTIFAGVNGCGKTSLYRFKKFLYSKNRINLDEIVHKMGGDYNSFDAYNKAANFAIKKIDQYFKSGKSFTWETTVISNGTLKQLKRAKECGYKIKINYVNVASLDIALERIKQRVQKGGHNVNDELVETRYFSQFNNIVNPLSICDEVYFYDNTKSMKIVGICKDNSFKYLDTNCDWMKSVSQKYEEHFINNMGVANN